MKNWFVGVEQKTKKSGVSKRTKKRDEKNAAEGKIKKNTKKKKTLQSCVDYLLSKKHENHINTKIYEIGNARHDLNNIFDEVDSVRLKNAATSFCASLPADLYHPSKDEWENIYHSTMENYCEALNSQLEKLEKAHHKKAIPSDERRKTEYHLNTDRYAQRLDVDEMKRLSVCVIHDDRNKPLVIGETSGSQMNLLISNVIDDKVVKLISQKAGVDLFKKAYVNAVKNELGLDPKNYLTYEERLEGQEHKDFYNGPSKVDVLELESATPRKQRKNQELRLKQEKKTYYKALNEKLDSVVERETQANKKIEQVPKAQELIKTANKAIVAKKKAISATDKAKAEFVKIEEKSKTAKNELSDLKKQVEHNKKWFLNFAKSKPMQEYISNLRDMFKKGFNFKLYEEVSKSFRRLQDGNEMMVRRIKSSDPKWVKQEKEKAARLEKERMIKHQNRHSGGVFEEEIKLVDEVKEEKKEALKQDNKQGLFRRRFKK